MPQLLRQLESLPFSQEPADFDRDAIGLQCDELPAGCGRFHMRSAWIQLEPRHPFHLHEFHQQAIAHQCNVFAVAHMAAKYGKSTTYCCNFENRKDQDVPCPVQRKKKRHQQGRHA